MGPMPNQDLRKIIEGLVKKKVARDKKRVANFDLEEIMVG